MLELFKKFWEYTLWPLLWWLLNLVGDLFQDRIHGKVNDWIDKWWGGVVISPEAIDWAILICSGLLSLIIVYCAYSMGKRSNRKKEIHSIPQARGNIPRKNPFDSLVEECKAADATHIKLTRRPEMFVMHWIYFINRLRNERNTHNIENLFNLIGIQNLAAPGNGHVNVGQDEVLYTLRCLNLLGYVVLKKTSNTLIGGVGGHYNEEIKFTEKYNTFIKQVRFENAPDGYRVYW